MSLESGIGQGFLRRFRDPIRVTRIENRVPRIRENYHRVPTGPKWVPNILHKKKLYRLNFLSCLRAQSFFSCEIGCTVLVTFPEGWSFCFRYFNRTQTRYFKKRLFSSFYRFIFFFWLFISLNRLWLTLKIALLRMKVMTDEHVRKVSLHRLINLGAYKT